MNDRNRISNREFGADALNTSRIVVTRDIDTGKFNYQKVSDGREYSYAIPEPPQNAPSTIGAEQSAFAEDTSDVWQGKPIEYPGRVVMPERKSKKRLRHQRFGQAIMLSAALTGSFVAIDSVTTLSHSGKMPNVIEDVAQLPVEIGKSAQSATDIADSFGRMINDLTSLSNIGDK